MFAVRCSPRPAPQPQCTVTPTRLLHACTLRARHARLPRPASFGLCSPPCTVCPPFDSAARASLQPAAELGHLRRHEHVRHVYGVPLPAPRAPPPPPRYLQSRPLPWALGVHTALARRLPRLPARSPHRTVCPACDPRQVAAAFNQSLSWNTSSVTNMNYMFDVSCSPRPAPQYCSHAPSLLHAACTRSDRAPCTRRRRRLVPHPLHPVRPPCDSADRKLPPVRGQQAAHPLRVGGQPRLPRLFGPRRLAPCWPTRMAFRRLLLKPSPRGVRAAGAEPMAAARTTARNMTMCMRGERASVTSIYHPARV